jgi:hypothetical protein
MGTYNLPRNVKGEGRILFVFTGKSFIYAIVGGGVGLIFYGIFSLAGLKFVGIVITVLFALIGFAIGTFKMPEISGLGFTKKVGGENLDDIIKRAIIFKTKGSKIYVYKEGKNDAK